MRKLAKVFTNDPRNRDVLLEITAFIKESIHISTQRVYFRGKAEHPATKTVDIVTRLNKSLKLEPTYFNLKQKVTYKIEVVQPGRSYRIHFTSLPGSSNDYYGVLRLKTNYPEKPEILLRVKGRFPQP
jgi:hypothetical protein